MIEAISDIRRSSLTFAVEAADDNLRRKIHKRLTIAELLEIIEYVFERGWKRIKLYFMIGLPGYEEADEAASIVELLRQITAIGRGRCDINATISAFVPKPHTPLERARMAPPEYLDDTVRRIRNGVSKKVAVKNHNIRSSIVEGILARGGRECADLIETVYAAGARLDSWKEYFRAPIWYDTLDSRYPEWREMLRERPAPEVLPWKAVDAGNTKLIEVRSRDLRPEEMKPRRGADTSVLDLEAFAAARGEFEKNFEMSSRLLVAVTKIGPARFVSHLDMLDTVKRGLRQLALPMTFTQGFNKQERVSAAWPLPLGYESIEELFVADLCADYDPALFTRSEFVFAEGMVARWAAPYTRKNALMAEICSSRYLVKSDRGYLEKAVACAANRPALVKRSKNGSEKAVTFEDTVLDLRLTDEGLEVHVPLGVPGALRPDDLLTQLTGEALAPGWRVIRLAQYTLENGEQMPFDRLAVTV